MAVCKTLLLAAVACVCTERLARSEDHLKAVSFAPPATVVAGGLDVSQQKNVAAPISDPFLRIGAAEFPRVATQLWATTRVQGSALWMVPLIAEAASRVGLPYDFLYRLLVRESGLRPDAVSPKGALGIAQFMPATAFERGLADPLDPREAVRKAAELLRDHKDRFGNIGLAAAAYNAGPGRVARWLGGMAAMPLETRVYVRAVTGREVESWSPVARMSTGYWAGQWTALLDPSEAPSGPHAPTRDTLGRTTARTVSSLGIPPKASSPKTGLPSIIHIGTGRTMKRLVRSEQAMCDLMNEQGKTCLVRQTY